MENKDERELTDEDLARIRNNSKDYPGKEYGVVDYETEELLDYIAFLREQIAELQKRPTPPPPTESEDTP